MALPKIVVTRRASWVVVLSIVGYTPIGLLASGMDWESTTASIPFRLLVLGLSVLILVRTVGMGPWRNDRLVLLFWTVYLVRLLWDLLIAGISGASEALVFFLAISVIPSLAVGTSGLRAIAGRATAWRLAGLGGFACGLATMMHWMGWGIDRSFTEATGRLSFEAINPITLGHTATTTLIALLCLSHWRMSARQSVLFWLLGATAVLCLLLSASRGPVVALAACAVVFAVVTGRWRWVVLSALLVAAQLLDESTIVSERFAGGLEDESSLERLLLQGNAISQFLDSPTFGSAFAELEFLTYPHNVFIETAMALGLVGLVLLLCLLVRTAVRAWRLASTGELLYPLLLLQYFVAFQFSGSIWGMASFWVLVMAVCSMAKVASSAQQSVRSTSLLPGARAQ